MGLEKLERLPEDAIPLTRHSDIKLVLDTPKGMFYIVSFFFFQSYLERYRRAGDIFWDCMSYTKSRCQELYPGLFEPRFVCVVYMAIFFLFLFCRVASSLFLYVDTLS